ncbi:hypothetical protein Bca4012_073557 [Brassica carinata]|uniref:Uncharacterized protein n=1 Tax=Brassica carinata TaxID=52824 RepID=A0A8X7QKZ1_BRACI|nr:hypothetical protein Bca52824_065857 [Brassica carinata]
MSLDLSSLPLFKYIKSILCYPRHTISPSHRHAITSAQAHCHTITSPLLKLTATPSPHVCYSLPSFQSMARREKE